MRAFFCLLEHFGVFQGLFAGKPAPTVDQVKPKPYDWPNPMWERACSGRRSDEEAGANIWILSTGNPIHPLLKSRHTRLQELPALTQYVLILQNLQRP